MIQHSLGMSIVVNYMMVDKRGNRPRFRINGSIKPYSTITNPRALEIHLWRKGLGPAIGRTLCYWRGHGSEHEHESCHDEDMRRCHG